MDCFVAYLAGHNRPVHEVLFPNKLSLEPAFAREFAGMTREPLALTTLERIQELVIAELPRALTGSHPDFLLSLVRAEPAYGLMTLRYFATSCLPSDNGLTVSSSRVSSEAIPRNAPLPGIR